MIERPASAGASIAPAAAEGIEAANAAPVTRSAAPLEGERSVHVIAAIGPDPALEPDPGPPSAALPRLVERPTARYGHTAARPAARNTPRASTRIEGMSYRAVFACCTEATDTPTE
jgi:hypothetical protein